MASENLKYQFAKLSFAEKLIAVNILVFLINGLFPFLLQWPKDSITSWFWLPQDLFTFISQPWSLVTYSFFHGSFWHLFGNMLILYFVSRIFLNLFDTRRFVSVYFLGVILGGLFFLVSYNLFPVFFRDNAILIGASAGVRAILIFVSAYIPNQEVRVFFFNVKLWYIGVFVVLMDFIQIPISNAGGNIAHLGGALLGYLYAKQLFNGRDIGEGFSTLLDGIGAIFTKKEKKAPMKTVYRKKTATATQKTQQDYDKEANQRKIDAILDKISKSGYESLSKAEKDFLFKAGKES